MIRKILKLFRFIILCAILYMIAHYFHIAGAAENGVAENGAAKNNVINDLLNDKKQNSSTHNNENAAPEQVVKPWPSIMFDKESITWIDNAIKSYVTKVPLEILMPSLFSSENNKKEAEQPAEESVKPVEVLPSDAPNFYLNSIIYFAPDDWVVWMNEEKITPENNNSAVKAVSVSTSSVIFVWNNTHLDSLVPDWKNKLHDIGESKYSSDDSNIVVDSKTGNASFILHPNQTMISKNMEIVEGDIRHLNQQETNTTADTNDKTTLGKEMIDNMKDTELGSQIDKGIDDSIKKQTDGIKGILEYKKQIDMLKDSLDQNKGL